MPVQLLPNRRYDSEYTVRLNIDGKPLKGWLSPALDRRDDERTLVLVTVKDADVPAHARAAFGEYKRTMEGFDLRRMSAAKLGVVAITERRWVHPRVRIAAHKMGPVPAMELTGSTVTLSDGRRADVVLFPHQPIALRRPSGSPSNFSEDLFRCLTAVDTEVLLKSYFQEIFSHLRDMADKLSISQGMKRIKYVREIQSQSILSKLSALTPNAEAWDVFRKSDPPERDPEETGTASYNEKVCQWFETSYTLVAESVYMLSIADKLLADYCGIMGLNLTPHAFRLRGNYYELGECLKEFERTYDLDVDPRDFSECAENAHEIISLYMQGQVETLRTLDIQDADAVKLREFALFILICRKELERIFGCEEFVSNDAIVFLSRRFNSEFSTAVKQAVETTVSATAAGGSRVTTFEGGGGEPIPEHLKAQIWLADAMWAVIPEQDEPVGENVKWVYLEPEHAFVLGKPSLYIARSQDDLQSAIARMHALDEAALSTAVMDRRDQLKSEFLGQAAAKVAIVSQDPAQIGERIGPPLAVARGLGGQIRRRAMLLGYLYFFQQADVEIFDFAIRSFAGMSFTKNQFVSAYERKHGLRDGPGPLINQFTRAYERSGKLAVKVGGQSFQPLVMLKNKKSYRCELVSIALALAGPLRPISEAMARQDVETCLAEILR